MQMSFFSTMIFFFQILKSRFGNLVFRPRNFVQISNMSLKIIIYLFKCENNKQIRIKRRKDQLRHIHVIMTSQSTGCVRFSWNTCKIWIFNNGIGIREYRAQASTNLIFLYKFCCNEMLPLLNFQGCRRLRCMFFL